MRYRIRTRSLSLRYKLMITSIAALVLPAVIMLSITSVYSQRIIREHSLETSTQSLTIVQAQINSVMEEMVSISNFILFDPEVRTLLEEAKSNPIAARQLTARLEQIAGEEEDLQVTLLAADGRAYSDYSFYDFQPGEFFHAPWFKQVANLSTYDTLFLGSIPNYLPPQSGNQQYVFLSARALKDSDSRPPYAYLIVSRTEDILSNFFAELEENIFISDAELRVISNREIDTIGTDFNEIFPLGELLTPAMIEWQGENQLYLKLPVKYANWTLVSVAPYEQLTSRLTGIYRSGLVLQGLFATIFLIALTYLLRRFMKPVLLLDETVRKVEAGDLSVRSNVRGGDELGSLGRSFDQMLDRIKSMLEQMTLEQELKRQAEIAMLQAQIHPHFLFNILNSIRLKLLINGDDENAQTIASLSSLLRASISSNEEFVTLHAELELAKQYMELMKYTMRHPVIEIFDVPSGLLLEFVPRFILQPIIENAYKHGFPRKGGSIRISGEQRVGDDRQRFVLRIEDDGRGMEADQLAKLQAQLTLQKRQIMEQSIEKSEAGASNSSGIGISNVYNRLKLLYGDLFEMYIHSVPNQRTVVELRIPMMSE
jgi:two-component system sensor histidine kinase YesM